MQQQRTRGPLPTHASPTPTQPVPQRYGPGQEAVAIDKEAQVVTFADGRKVAYESLISTIPLDLTLRWMGKPEWADGLTHSSSHIVGIGEAAAGGGGGREEGREQALLASGSSSWTLSLSGRPPCLSSRWGKVLNLLLRPWI